MKVWIFLAVASAVLHVSDPYTRTGFTLELKARILVWTVRLQDVLQLVEGCSCFPYSDFHVGVRFSLFVHDAIEVVFTPSRALPSRLMGV